MSTNAEIKSRHDAVIFPCTGIFYGEDAVALNQGKGSYVTDYDGAQYLDFFRDNTICTLASLAVIGEGEIQDAPVIMDDRFEVITKN